MGICSRCSSIARWYCISRRRWKQWWQGIIPYWGGGVESTKITAAKEAVEAAEKAYQQAKDLLEKAKEDNQITAEENAALEEANQAIKDAKTKAEEALKNLPKDKEQEALKERLDAVNPIEIPENGGNPSTDPEQPAPTNPTDNQGNTGEGKQDVSEQTKNAEKLVKAAEDALKAVEQAKTDAGKAISDAEAKKINDLIDAYDTAKAKADNAMSEVPNKDPSYEGLKGRHDALPATIDDAVANDKNANDIADSKDVQSAQEALDAAEEAKDAVEQAKTDAGEAISDADAKKINDLIDAYDTAKAKADKAMSEVPSKDPSYEGLKGRHDALPATIDDAVANDKNANDIADSKDVQSAQEALDAAEEAKDAVEQAKTDAGEAISDADAKKINDLIDAYDTAKAKADKAMSEVPSKDPSYEGLKGRHDALPATIDDAVANDKNANDIADSKDVQSAQEALDAAEEAKDAVEQAKTDAGEAISDADAKKINDLIDAYDTAKAKADKAMSEVPSKDPSYEGLKGRYDALPATIDDVVANDKGDNGVPGEKDAVTSAQEALDAAEKAKDAVEQAKTEAGEAISDADAKKINDLIDAYDTAKAKADKAMEAVPDQDPSYEALKGRHDALPATIDDVVANDKGDNGVPGEKDAVTSAQEALDAAEKAKDAVEQAKTEAGEAISDADAKKINDLIDAYDTAKAKADKAMEAVPDQDPSYEALKGRHDALPATIDDVVANDKGDNGVPGEKDAVTSAQEALDAAEKAKDAVEQAKTEAGEAISDADAKKINDLIDAYDTAKAKADDAMSEVPSKDPSYEALKGRYDALPATIDDVVANDKGDNGVPGEKDAVTSAQEALDAAEKAKDAVEQAKTEAGEAISDADAKKINDLIDAYDTAKAKADKAMSEVPSKDPSYEGLKGRHDALPATIDDAVANDKNANDIADSKDVQSAQEALDAAEEAKDAVEQAKTEAGEAISDADAKKINDLIDAYDTAKAKADKAMSEVPSKDPSYEGLKGRHDALPATIDDAVANDKNANDIADSKDVQSAQEALDAAEEAKDAVEQAKTEAGEAISDADAKKINDLIDAYDTAKAKADKAMSEVPSKDPSYEGLKGRHDALPATIDDAVANDKNANDIADSKDVQSAQEALDAAEEAKDAVEQAKTEAGEAISDADAKKINDLIDAYDTAKAKADKAMSEVPSKDPSYEGLKGRHDALPATIDDAVANDKNANDIADSKDVQSAQEALDAAEEAKDAVEQAKTDAGEAISDADAKKINDLIDAYDTAKAKADKAMSEVPSKDPSYEGLKGRHDALPATIDDAVANDKNANDIADSKDVQSAQEALDAAEEAKDAVEQAKTDAGEAISDADAKKINDLIDAYDTAKAKADKAMSEVPSKDPSYEGLKGRYDALPATIDDVVANDKGDNGVPGEKDAVTSAQEALDAAEKAKDAVEQAKTEAGEAISDADAKKINDLIDAYDTAKAKADKAMEAVPDQDPSYEALKGRHDALPATIDDVVANDKGDNGVPGEKDAVTSAQEALDAAEKAKDAVEQAKTEAGEAISDADAKKINDLIDAYDTAKAKADKAMEAVPDQDPSYEALKGRHDALPATIDDVVANDKGDNGVPGEKDAVTSAQEALDAAEKAKDAVEQAKTEAGEAISDADAKKINDLIDAYDTAKAKADDAMSEVPSKDPSYEALKGRYDALPATIDDVVANDKGDNGVPGEKDAVTSAQEALDAAEKAKDAVEQAKTEAGEAISDADAKKINDLIDAYDTAKAKADKAMSEVPSKDPSYEGLKGRHDALPATIDDAVANDKNANDIADSKDVQSAQEALDAAEEAKDAVEQAKTEAGEAISDADAKKINDLIDAYDTAKAKADKAMSEVPSKDPSYEGLKGRHDALPATIDDAVANDKNANDIADSKDVQSAQEALDAAEEAKDAVEQAKTEAGEAISDADAKKINDLIDAYDTAKAKADKAMSEVPSKDPSYEGLKGRHDALPATIDDAVANDKNANDIADSKDVQSAQEALDAAEEAKDAVEQAKTDAGEAISDADAKKINDLIDAYDTAKAKADKAMSEVPSKDPSYEGLKGRHDALPATIDDAVANDKNANDIADSKDVQSAQEALDAAEEAKDAVEQAKTDAGEAISDADAKKINDLIDAYDTAKAKADKAMSEVPSKDPSYEGLKGRYDALPATIDDVVANDKGDNGVPGEKDAVTSAQEALDAAEKAKDAVEQAKTEAGEAISDADAKKINDLIDAYDTAKAKADKAMEAVPDQDPSYEALKGRHDALPATIDDVVANDKGDNGVPGEKDAVTSAQEALDAAEKAKDAVEQAKTEAGEAISDADAKKINDLIDAYDTAKAKADKAMSEVPSKDPSYEGLKGRHDALPATIDDAVANDKNANDIADSKDVQSAQEALDAAEEAKDAVEQAKTEAGEAISDADAKKINDLIDAYDTAKAKADKAMSEVPSKDPSYEGLKGRHDALPATIDDAVANDKNANDIADSKDVQSAQEALDAAEEAKDAVEQAKTEAGEAISDADAKKINDLIDAYDTAKAKADKAMSEVPSKDPSYEGLKGRHDALPATIDDAVANDKNANDIADSKDVQSAQEALDAAEEAKDAVEQAKTDAGEAISDADAKKINDLIDAYDTAKAKADKAMSEVPSKDPSYEGLKGRHDALPATIDDAVANDKNANDIADSKDVQSAQEALDAAEEAKDAVEQAKTDAGEAISDADAKKINDLIDAYDTAKAKADKAMSEVPSKDPSYEGLKGRHDALPATIDDAVANDKNANDIADSKDVQSAQEALDAAEEAKDAVEQAKTDAGEAISDADAKKINDLIDAYDTAKAKADKAMSEVPSKDPSYEGLKGRHDALPATIDDAVANDKNANDIADSKDVQSAQEALDAAEEAKDAVEQAKTEAGEAISDADAKKINDLIDAYDTAKAKADKAMSEVPSKDPSYEGLKGRHDALPATIDDAVANDKNANDIADSKDVQSAQEALDAAEEAKDAVEQAKTEAGEAISDADAKKINDLIDAYDTAKAKADKAMSEVPSKDPSYEGLKGRHDALPATIDDAVANDKNANDIADSKDVQSAQEALDAAEEAKDAVEQAKTEAGEAISDADAKKINDLIDAYDTAKAKADKAMSEVPSKDPSYEGLKGRHDALPATIDDAVANDKNANDIADSKDVQSAQEALDAAEEAKDAVEQAKTDAGEAISDADAKKINDLIDAYDTAKAKADKAMSEVPSKDPSYEGLKGRHDALPATIDDAVANDKNDNDVPDDQDLPLAFDSESKPTVADGGNKVILNLNGKATSDHTADTFEGNKATLIFGDATSPNEKVHTLTGAGNGRIKVYNPKLDWDMRTSDDGTGAQRDHAPGWDYDEEALRQDAAYNSYNPDDNRAYFYKWTGAEDAADIILVENVQTDPGNNDTKVQGMIASEAKGAETKQVRFALDTLAGGNDYIKAKGVGGHVKIKTNEGDDVIELGYMNGRKGVGVPFYDGSNQIDMGEGNDKLLVTSQSADQGVSQLGYDNGSLYYTNAKIDMGEGDNEVSIYHNIIAGAEDGSGNYIRFGSGNDKLTVGGYIGGESASTATGYKSSNIIDLGGGHNTVQVKGGLYQQDTTKFLMVSDGSSEVTFDKGIGGRSSMMMGDGADTVVVKGNAEFNSDPYYWLDGAFIKNMEEGAKNDMYKGFYETAFKQKVSDKLVSAIDRAGAGSETVLGAKGLNPNETNIDNARSIGTRIDLGNGENTLSISGSVLRLNYLGGTDSDTVTLGATSESRFWMGDGTNTLSLGSSSSVGYSGGTGTDTITIKGNVNNNSTFNIGSGDNSITITGNAEQTWIGVSNNDQGFAQSGNDTVTINGSLTGKGIETEVINLGAGQDRVTISGALQDSLIRMGDGNDNITINGITYNSNRIDAGKGDDVITVTNQINSTNTHLIGGEGNDTFTVQYFRGDNQNAVSGGTGKDTLNITGNNNQFIVGYSSGWTNLWSIEEIVFKGTSGNNKIRIDTNVLTADNNKSLYIKNQSSSTNTVDVNAGGRLSSKTTQYEDRDGDGHSESYSYKVYTFSGGYTLYIEDSNNIKVI
ncbi:hypothetical protein QRO24_11200 [Gallibacterium anatis]|uniref:GA-like domain-containing protein n=1 Tax=Gallibacterium anatis TaxID=750 RepID=UPI0038D4DE19